MTNLRGMKIEDSTKEIPKWVIEYNNAGYQSGAGRAVKLLMDKLKLQEEANAELIAALEEVLDYIEGDTAGRMMDDKIKRLISKHKAQ